ncbi:hypothetical protein DFP72DRAFT_1139235 [Ephemerocybe angulata]|uniref:Uncharacterized protein n=1 Tax=Ephemerocybe angulata TaxID=980116 RepID=A0A8H6M3T9_9AGAR|nr:hypothetical protein DFP72DRAFT_1139235 [Tulosesus angulatus]
MLALLTLVEEEEAEEAVLMIALGDKAVENEPPGAKVARGGPSQYGWWNAGKGVRRHRIVAGEKGAADGGQGAEYRGEGVKERDRRELNHDAGVEAWPGSLAWLRRSVSDGGGQPERVSLREYQETSRRTYHSEDDIDGSEACVEWLAVPCSAYLWLVVVEVIWMVVRPPVRSPCLHRDPPPTGTFESLSLINQRPCLLPLYHPTPGLTDVEGEIERWTHDGPSPPFRATSRGSERDVTTIRSIIQLQTLDVALCLSLTPLNVALVVGSRCRGSRERSAPVFQASAIPIKSKENPDHAHIDRDPKAVHTHLTKGPVREVTNILRASIWRAFCRYNLILIEAECYSVRYGAGEGGSVLAPRRALKSTFEDANAQSA